MPKLYLDERAKQDSLEIVELRIRGQYKAMDRHDDRYAAFRFICNGERLGELMKFYLGIYERTTNRRPGRLGLDPEQLSDTVRRESIAPTSGRPLVFSTAVMAYQDKFEPVLLEELMRVIDFVDSHRGGSEFWDERAAERDASGS